MMDAPRCARCGSPVSADRSGEGLCPRCLLAGALVDQTGGDLDKGLSDGLEPRYRILTVLGEGRSGRSLLAMRDRAAGQLLVVKIFPGGPGAGRLVEHLETVSALMASLAHPGIVELLEVGRTGDGRPLTVRRYQQGVPLATYCEQARLDVTRRLDLIHSVCGTVGAAHAAGLAHGHLVSGNLLAAGGPMAPRIAIVDWGHCLDGSDRSGPGPGAIAPALRDDIGGVAELLDALIEGAKADDRTARLLAVSARRQNATGSGYRSIGELAADVERVRERLRV